MSKKKKKNKELKIRDVCSNPDSSYVNWPWNVMLDKTKLEWKRKEKHKHER